MGMPISLLARGAGAQTAQAAVAVRSLFDELIHVDAVFSPYQPDSEVSRIGRGELSIDEARPEVREVAERCSRAQILTGGIFDANRPDGSWDPSGLVKGWAVQRAARHLAVGTDTDWCVNAGGDVLALCPSGDPFLVGIQDPRDARRVAATVSCQVGAVATSGTAARGAHLYDPRSGGAASTRWLSVTVAGPSLETADVLATAAFVAGEHWADIVALVPGYQALVIAADGRLATTAGWPGTRHGTLDT